jgi:hypothetical protein
VTDGSDRLGLFEEPAHKGHGLVAAAQVVSPHGASRHDERVVIPGGDLGYALLDHEGLSRVDVAVHGLGFADLQADYLDCSTRLLYSLLRLCELDLLGTHRSDEYGDLAASKLFGHR